MSVIEKLARAICEADTTAPKPDEPIYIKMRAAKAWEGREAMAQAVLGVLCIDEAQAAAIMGEKAAVVGKRRLAQLMRYEDDARSGFADRTLLTALDITEAQAAALMDGSAVVVAREASPEMLAAGQEAMEGSTFVDEASLSHVGLGAFGDVYRAMLAAASQHEETKG